MLITAIGNNVSSLIEACQIIAAFQGMIRKKALADLDPWLEPSSSRVRAVESGYTR